MSSGRGKRCYVFLLAIVALAAPLVRPAGAVLIAYEGFEYAAGDLAGLNGGTGWNAAWVRNAGTGSILDGGLSYTDSAGNQLAVAGGHAFFSGQSGNGDFHRDLPSVQGATDGTTTWWSFIGERLSPHGTDDDNVIRAASLQVRNTVTTTPSVERLAVGKGTTHPSGNPSVPIEYNWGMLHSGNAGNSTYTSSSHLQQAFLVVRIDHSGDSTVADSAWLWVNPRLDQEPNVATADASMTGLTSPTSIDFSFNRIRAFAGNSNAQGPYANLAIDEIRLGTTYAAVAPIAGPGGDDADFNGDGVVDGADFVIWQRGLGVGTTNSQGDANGDNFVNGADLEVWRSQFSPTAQGAAAGVPEPASAAVAAVG
ncbi:MAG TPA: hypothetical protein PJ982_15215, partial [Lacipirellulaceae bacterium]|nr:hypothetical protein [Lacipirellulaceae bacterium]